MKVQQLSFNLQQKIIAIQLNLKIIQSKEKKFNKGLRTYNNKYTSYQLHCVSEQVGIGETAVLTTLALHFAHQRVLHISSPVPEELLS